MVHFKLLVIGDNVDGQLAPYDENLEVEPYKDPTWDYHEELEAARRLLQEQQNTSVDINDPREVLDWWMSGDDFRWNDDKTRLERWSTYNPDSKWDYWLVGGRYSGAFIIKPDADKGDYAPSDFTDDIADERALLAQTPGRILSDHARKRAIDFDAMRIRAVEAAKQEWEGYQKATEGIPVPEQSFTQLRELHGSATARHMYRDHPWVQATIGLAGPGAYEHFEVGDATPEETFIKKREMFAVAGYYAVLQDGRWEEREGIPGFDAPAVKAWERVLNRINSLPDDTLLTVVDCHI